MVCVLSKDFRSRKVFRPIKECRIFFAVGFGLDGIASSGVVILRLPQV
jgi:hypothetical protein